MTEPVETYDDGGALYEVGPFEVAAQPPGEVNPGVVSIDGRTVTPHTARQLARVLEVAADRAQGQRPSERDRTRAQHLAAIDRDRADALAAANDPELSTEQRARSQGYADALTRCWPLLTEQSADPAPGWVHGWGLTRPERPADLDPAYRTQES